MELGAFAPVFSASLQRIQGCEERELGNFTKGWKFQQTGNGL